MEVDELFVKLGLIPDKESFEQGDELIHKLKEGLEFFAGFEAIKGLGELIEHTVEATVESKHLAERLGISIEAVQQLGYAADVSGSNVNELRVGLQHLTLGLEHASKTGSGPMIDGLHKLNISLGSLKGKDLDEKLMSIADGFKEAGPNVDKTAASMEIFGTRIGPKLLPLLNKGSEGIKELREEFVKLGGQTDGETAEAMERLEESQKRLKYAWGGIKDEIVAKLIPALQPMLEGLLAWVMANREIIGSTITGVVDALITGFHALGEAVQFVAKVIQFFTEHAELGQAVLYAFGALITMVAAEAFAAWVAGMAPIIAIGAVLAGLIYLAEGLAHAFTDGKGPIASALYWIQSKIEALGDKLESWGRRFISFFTDDIPNAIGEAWDAIFDAVVNAATAAWAKIRHLPVVKQALDFGESVSGVDLGGAIANRYEKEHGKAPEAPGAEAYVGQQRVSSADAAIQAATNQTQVTTISVGGITIDVPQGMDAAHVAELVESRIQGLARDTHASLGGQ